MKNNIFSRLRKLGEWKHSEETFKAPRTSSFPTPEKLRVQSDVANFERYSSLKEEVLKDMTRWSSYSPNGKSIVIQFRRWEYDKPTYDLVIQELLGLGWEVATREYVDLVPIPHEEFPDNPFLTITLERNLFEILVAYPGTIDEAIAYNFIENTEFVVCKEGVSLDEKEHVPQDMGKD